MFLPNPKPVPSSLFFSIRVHLRQQSTSTCTCTFACSNTLIPVDDGFNEYESALKRQKFTTSKVWDEMTKLECENKNELKAQCNHYFVETILSNLRLLFDEYVKKYKSTSSSLAGSSNVSDKNLVDSSLDEHNVNSADFGGYFDKSDDYKRYLNESSTKSEKS
ncbi:hypothetical protein V6Z12_D09G093800 [Gossypium hirsutum]|uniref:Uncharacterized protein isoform X2 n=1 Tax=Gossypium hirsutum TaxID=3635 RepID=A0ABM3ANT7_GOSHI|nr:uncharacterized protein LOC107891763 isoform X2 [Gossypium hirsutum]